MRADQRFFVCEHCGNLTGIILDARVPLQCCGERMTELVPNTVEASFEKHLPSVVIKEGIMDVRVGSAPHPMEEAHHITFIFVQTQHGGQRRCLSAGEEPHAAFRFENDIPQAVYAYCNLHGLWKTEI